MNKNRCVSWIFNFCTFESRSYFAAYVTHIWVYEKYTVLCEQCKLNSYGATPVTGQSATILMIKLIVEIIFHPKIQKIPWFQLLKWDNLLLFFVLCSCTRGCSVSNTLLTNKSIEKMIGRIVAALSEMTSKPVHNVSKASAGTVCLMSQFNSCCEDFMCCVGVMRS